MMVKKPEDVVYEVEKALYITSEGRRGPCWVDIPMDIQSSMIETDGLRHFEAPQKETKFAQTNQRKPERFIEN